MRFIVDSYYSSVTNGTLGRMRFFGLFLSANAIWILLGIGIVAMIGAAEHLVGGDLQEAQAVLRSKLGVPSVVALAFLGLAFFFALMNITAKRIRDIGLPGWTGVVVIIVLLGVVTQFGTDKLQQGVSSLVLLALVLIPGRSAQSENNTGSTP